MQLGQEALSAAVISGRNCVVQSALKARLLPRAYYLVDNSELWLCFVCFMWINTHLPPPPNPKETTTKHDSRTLKYCDEDTGQHGEEHLKSHLSAWQLAYSSVHCFPGAVQRKNCFRWSMDTD